MEYKSTRGAEAVSETYALLHGLAKDGGLYVPAEFPKNCLSYGQLEGKTYQEIALMVLSKFFHSFGETVLREMIAAAYHKENFVVSEIASLFSLEEDVTVLELFQGRTQAFKDMALSLFPYLLVGAKTIEGETKDILILTATSGDTGKAALEGFKDVVGTFIQVFYPTDGVSPMQQAQMQKQEGENVCVTAIRGNFDDAQQFLKKVFLDERVNHLIAEKGFVFSSANSINIGRLLPQIVYYVSAYAALVEKGAILENEQFDVVVPTGNFGNILAAYLAKKMGIPVGKLICASNQNNVLTEFFATGTYDMNREFYTTLSPSMDILESSNFERFLYYVMGEDTKRTASLMADLKANGSLSITEDELKRVQEEFVGAYVTDEETRVIIEQVYNSQGYLMDPHTAVAMGAFKVYQTARKEKQARHTIIAATAHPFKFPMAICESLGIREGKTAHESLLNISAVTGIAFPKPLEELEKKTVRFTDVVDKDKMKDAILKFVDMCKREKN